MATHTPLREMTRAAAQQRLAQIAARAKGQQARTAGDVAFMNEVVYGVERLFLHEIRQRQARIPDLDTGEFGYTAVWGGELTPGCSKCIEHDFESIRSASSCNLRCDFCFYASSHDAIPPMDGDHFGVGKHQVTARDVKLMITKAMRGPTPIEGLAWVWLEPFVDFDKHPELIAWIHEQGIYQHMYTNGTLCTADQLKVLADAGLDELRFNLAATKCADSVIAMMRVATDLFEWVCVESPMVPEYVARFVKKRTEILATGVSHIHCAELHLGKDNLAAYSDHELYRYGRWYVSPMFSRRLTYDLMDLAVAEQWPNIVLHDCSNEVKFLRGATRERFGGLRYDKELQGLPLGWYARALRKYDFTVLDGPVGPARGRAAAPSGLGG